MPLLDSKRAAENLLDLPLVSAPWVGQAAGVLEGVGRQQRNVLQLGAQLTQAGRDFNVLGQAADRCDGRLRALGTRFLVKREEDGTRLSVLQSQVAAQPETSGHETVYNEGQQVLMQRDSLGPMLALSPGADAWTRGMLVLDNVRLADMVRELNRYRRGHLGVDPQVADLRISGSFALNNVELALNALQPTLPVKIEHVTPWCPRMCR